MPKLDQLIRSFNRQANELSPVSYILQGSVVRRKLQRQVGSALKSYGPYYLWTRKINGKTVTMALTNEQSKIIREAIDRNRQIEQSLNRLRFLSEQIIVSVSPSVAKRKRSHRF
jgi:spermidine synthase